MTDKNKNLAVDSSLHRTLAKRLGIAALLIAIIAAGLVVLFERNRIGDTVIDRALQRTESFNQQYQGLLDAPGGLNRAGLARALDELADNRLKERLGYFVYAEIYDTAGARIGEFADGNYRGITDIQSRLTSSSRPTPARGSYYHDSFWIGLQPYIHIATPLTHETGETAAYLRGVFAVSEVTSTEIKQRIMRVVAMVAGIVLVTTALLYPVILNLTRKLTIFSGHLLESNLEMLQVLGSAIAKRDSDTNAHNFRVSILAVRLAEAAGLDAAEIKSLIKGAFLHDVGKIAISDSILHKPGRLDKEEFAVMKTHVDHGLDIVARSVWLTDASAVVGNHHEKCDGSGYPQGLAQQDIPVTARIFSIADVFDALTSRRPYKEPYSFKDSMRILEEGRGSHFDPQLLDTFATIARELYDLLTGREDDGLRTELETITRHYFSGSMDVLE